MTKPLANK